MSEYGDDDLYDDLDEEEEDADCHAGNADTLIGAWQVCGMAGTEYCDWECTFARRARAAIAKAEGTS